MTKEEFIIALKEIMNIDFSKYDNGKKFTDEFRKDGNVIYQASCYIKYYAEPQKHIAFLIDEDKVEELKTLVKKINTKIDEMAHDVIDPNCHPNFAYFHRAYWDMGYELNVSRRCKIEEEKRDKELFDESPMGQYIKKYGVSPCEGCPSLNCKRCQYGDDGDYSIYDVYTPSELGISVVL